MANTERLLPRATTALAKTVWERQREPSARKVARALAAAGYPVHFTTVAPWKRTGWRPTGPTGRHPLAEARAGLESVAPVVTGNPHTSIEDLIGNHPERKNFEKLTDAELLRLAAREAAMAVVIIARTIQARAVSLVSTNAGGVADLLKSVATALDAVGSAFVQALTLRRGRMRAGSPRRNGLRGRRRWPRWAQRKATDASAPAKHLGSSTTLMRYRRLVAKMSVEKGGAWVQHLLSSTQRASGRSDGRTGTESRRHTYGWLLKSSRATRAPPE